LKIHEGLSGHGEKGDPPVKQYGGDIQFIFGLRLAGDRVSSLRIGR
jgi:hypothetical protein